MEHLADVLIPRPNRGKYMASLVAAYGDESGSPRIFAIAIYIGTIDRWAAFEKQWKSALEAAGLNDEGGNLIPFHMADFESRFGPFADWSSSKRISVIRDLIGIIHNAELVGLTAVLSLESYRRWLPVNPNLPLVS
jgi:hypothetical protein